MPITLVNPEGRKKKMRLHAEWSDLKFRYRLQKWKKFRVENDIQVGDRCRFEYDINEATLLVSNVDL